MIAAYVPDDDDGVLRPEMPDVCPLGRPGEACWVVIDHWRDRKTGPRHPLLVARCSVHDRAFTVYPPGHVPYGRSPVVRVAPDGTPLQGDDWQGTAFAAVQDAAEGRPWERSIPPWSDAEPDPDLDVGGWWGTQGRHLDRALRWLALDVDDDDVRHRRCRVLDVPTLVAVEAVASIRAAPGYRTRGQAAMQVLDAMGRPRGPRLVTAGHLAGLWGRPRWWCGGVLRSISGADPPPARPRSARGSTKVGRGTSSGAG